MICEPHAEPAGSKLSSTAMLGLIKAPRRFGKARRSQLRHGSRASASPVRDSITPLQHSTMGALERWTMGPIEREVSATPGAGIRCSNGASITRRLAIPGRPQRLGHEHLSARPSLAIRQKSCATALIVAELRG